MKNNVLPEGFKTWYQFYLKNKEVFELDLKEVDIQDQPEEFSFTNGLVQRYEFDKDFVKARVFEEIKDLLITNDELMSDEHNGFPHTTVVRKTYALDALSKGYKLKY